MIIHNKIFLSDREGINLSENEAAEPLEIVGKPTLDHMSKKVWEVEVVCIEDMPLGQRILSTFSYHTGLSYHQIEPFVERSHKLVQQWFQQLEHLFEPDYQA
jgi:hypothetical protein